MLLGGCLCVPVGNIYHNIGSESVEIDDDIPDIYIVIRSWVKVIHVLRDLDFRN